MIHQFPRNIQPDRQANEKSIFYYFAFLVGSPIEVVKKAEPEWAEVCELHQKYISELRGLFEKYKTQFGYSEDYQLEILWTLRHTTAQNCRLNAKTDIEYS